LQQTIEYIKQVIKPGMNLLEIRKLCENKMLELELIYFATRETSFEELYYYIKDFILSIMRDGNHT